MDVNITKAFSSIAPMDYSASRIELGDDAGPRTWAAANEDANEFELLTTPDELQAMRDFVRSAGAWDDAEIAAFSDTELRALFLQWIAGDMRECGLDASDADWAAYEVNAQAGQCPSNIYRADDGNIYFSLES